ncbi:MAG: hypothetical protein US62_C0001G0014 [Candidatus Woesebacteria bacterium GW2011_GWA1_37_8]|uniref:Dockerin domain-containing protein n=2 Tax=Candidatus Woeseibacteriota TaxID=1752722 RepID=A0A0G0PET8_9BACT|nr:MAG: hypothetical protein US62_C0001G0014 [Candidatus Woesebacteria bacterium GW2011_GWA1_37_8]KKQ87801.1 MAG: hypothetical protein UT10_C0001G0042 [Candidatus Woesebacteria bacterium GW2011_GWB1_38_8b]
MYKLRYILSVVLVIFVIALVATDNLLAQTPTRKVCYHGVDNVSNVNDFTVLRNYGINLVQAIVNEGDLNKLNSYIQKAEETNMYLIIWPNGPHFCGSDCIPWNLVNGVWVIDEAEKPILNRIREWYQTGRGRDLLIGINTFQEPRNDGITLAQQVALTNKIKSEYNLPIANWIDNVVDTGISSKAQWQAIGADAIDWPISWTHCIPFYQGSGGNTCQSLTCEIANSSNPSCCLNQWASSCSNKCYGPEGTCGYGLEKMKRDRAVVGENANYGVLLQAFENVGYNNAHVPTADQMYEEACRVARSGVVDMMIWYDWDRSYSGYTKTLHNGQFDPEGKDRWAMLKKITDDCIGTLSPNCVSPAILKPGDANGDGRVDGTDYVIWLIHYNQSIPGPSNGNFNSDGVVDGADYVIWLTNYNV